MACNDERASQIGEFIRGELPADKMLEILEHMSTCESCSADFDLATDILNCQQKFGDEIFEPEKSAFASILEKLSRKFFSGFRRASTIISGRFKPIVTAAPMWQKLAAAAVPVAVAIVFAIVFIQPYLGVRGRLRTLAVIEPEPYVSASVRRIDEEHQELFDEGMELYNQNRYREAIPNLSRALSLNPQYAQAAFYLGVCYLMEDEAGKSIRHFQQAIELTRDSSKLEKSRWYLAKAYLRKGDAESAIAQLQKVIVFDGSYRNRAQELIKKIRAAME